ncbi:hypothetical protein LOTGIDRAFT_195172 [Lottia gigantea]|uniref:Serpin domain-containing protein n=1 Tax=Lottia gigantea TaxID=225164 RepID=V3ZQ27_LOTGI|nr:hypothetical protein LOTGIDRAFT_195172 [Lottia gigantea]ESO86437.1 hypothetical protein LOTGIDRAFT_195172 [Lottia gigantea]
MEDLSKSNMKFGIDLLKTVASSKKNENLFMSPFSIQTVMAMLHVGSRNNSKKEIENVLRFESDEIHASFGKYLEMLHQKDSTYSLSAANKMFIHNKFEFLDSYLDTLKATYKSTAEKCDFGRNPEGEREKINAWVEGETNSKIKDLIPSGVLNGLTAMVLANAIYFKGDWENKFEVSDTKLKFGFYKALNSEILELPYVKKDLSMFFILPRKVDGVSALTEQLTDEHLVQLMRSVYPTKVDVMIPKFSLESDLDLKTILIDLGIKDTFDMNKADLSGINGNKDLYVSDAFHKAFVEVNEEGTEAAAATAAVIMTRSIQIPRVFRADHPFIFFIHDNRTNMVLFWGQFSKPKGEIKPTRQEL